MASEDRLMLAEDRTNLAEDRTVLANERTFAGWMRTAMSAIGIGLGFHALFNRMEPGWVPRSIATAFMLIGIFVIVTAERRARTVINRLSAHRVARLKPVNLRLIAIGMSLASAALIAAIWLLPLKPR